MHRLLSGRAPQGTPLKPACCKHFLRLHGLGEAVLWALTHLGDLFVYSLFLFWLHFKIYIFVDLCVYVGCVCMYIGVCVYVYVCVCVCV